MSRGRARGFATLLALTGVGGLVAVQTRTNGALGAAMDDGIVAAAFVFLTGLTITACAMCCSPSGRAGLRRIIRRIRERADPWWIAVGGAIGTVVVISQGTTAAILGNAIFGIGLIAGQTSGALIADHFGLGPGGRRPATFRRALGAALALVAVAVSVSSHLTADFPLALLVIPVVAGVCLGCQHAINGRARVAAGSVVTATFLSFSAASLTIVAITGVHVAIDGRLPTPPTEWWMYAGGVLGVAFIAANAILVRRVGVLLLTIGTTMGQLLGSLCIELLAPVSSFRVDLQAALGAVLAFIAVAIVTTRARIGSGADRAEDPRTATAAEHDRPEAGP